MTDFTVRQPHHYRDAIIKASEENPGWIHVIYIPIEPEERSMYPADRFVLLRSGMTEAGKLIGQQRKFSDGKGGKVLCQAWAAAFRGILSHGSDIPEDKYFAYAKGKYKA